MGVFGSGRFGGCACGRRRPAAGTTGKHDGEVCPISGKAGTCPISGQMTQKTETPASETSASEKADGSAPGVAKGGPAPSAASVAKAAEHKERGGEYFKKQEYQEALEEYNEALLLLPRDATLWLNRSLTNRQLKNWEDAQDDAEIAAGLQPGNAKAHYSRALALQQMGRLRKALGSCQQGLKAQPDNKALLQLRSTLKSSLGAPNAKARVASETEGKRSAAEASPDVEQSSVEAVTGTAAKCPASLLGESAVKEIQASSGVYMWRNGNPSEDERESLKSSMVGMFKQKYLELKAKSAAHKATLKTDQYEQDQKLGLQLKGGHQPMKRPEHVDLPSTYQEPLGIISLEELSAYGCDNEDGRYILSIYGDLFDISDRPDKYGPEGPYASLTGKDLTWGLFAGVDTTDYCNRCYDLFKARDLGKDKLAGLYSWLAWYETEYGQPVGRLEPYTRERFLPEPPLEEVDGSCAVM